MNSRSKSKGIHYCDLNDDCYRCMIPFCPYEKLEDGTESGWADIDDVMYEDEDEEEGW